MQQFIEKANKVHNNKYDYSHGIYINTQTKILITCQEHGDFYQMVYAHLLGSGCAQCSRNSRKNTKEQFISKSKEIHNNKYDYLLVNYINNSTKVQIICNIHGTFEIKPNSHMNGQGCKQCGVLKRIKGVDIFIEKANQIHNHKYDYSQADFINTLIKIAIICPVHGVFYQQPIEHQRGKGCRMCYADSVRGDVNEFIQKVSNIHSNKYDYSYVKYKNVDTKIQIGCDTHGLFEMTPMCHIAGQGCNMCQNKTEGKLFNFLTQKYSDLHIIQQKKFDWLIYNTNQRLDFYIEEFNIAIELQGQQHFEHIPHFKQTLEEQQNKDLNKKQLLQKYNIPIIYIYQPDVWCDKQDWQTKLQNAIQEIITNKETWQCIEIGSVYD